MGIWRDKEKRNAYVRAWRAKNIERVREQAKLLARKRRAADPEKAMQYRRDYAKKNFVKLSAAWRRRNGLPEPLRPCPVNCESCGRASTKKSLHLDHDHATGKFRGWLCYQCNLSLGMLADSPVYIRNLLEYLERSNG